VRGAFEKACQQRSRREFEAYLQTQVKDEAIREKVRADMAHHFA